MAQPPHRAIRNRPGSGTATPTSTHGSQTILQTNEDSSFPSATLRLRAEPAESSTARSTNDQSRRIRWSEDVIDNEGMGKKSSKVCCIYHAPRELGDSESEDSSSSSDDGDSEPDLSRARPAGKGKRRRQGRQDHDHGKGEDRKPSPNAYERQPAPKSKSAG